MPRIPDGRDSALWAETEARQLQEARFRAALPELKLHIWAAPDGVRVEAVLITPAGEGRTKQEWIAAVTFQPAEVTEIGVVDWGRRCLAAWLEKQAAPEENA